MADSVIGMSRHKEVLEEAIMKSRMERTIAKMTAQKRASYIFFFYLFDALRRQGCFGFWGDY